MNATKTLKCSAVPNVAALTIKAARAHGSQGRFLQVATELLIRQKRPVRLKYKIQKEGKEITVSYKLLPRTIELIDRLTPVYGTRGRVILACSEVLKESK